MSDINYVFYMYNVRLNDIQSYNNETITHTYLKQYKFPHIKNSIKHKLKYYKQNAKS